MSHVAFVTDSTSNLPPDVVQRLGLTVVPVYVIFGAESYKDYVQMPPVEFYRRLMHGGTMPTTSQPSVEDFRLAYEACKQGGATDIISVHVTAKASGTCNSARLGGDEVDGVLVHVVDSGTTSLLMGWMIEAAQAALADGRRIEGAIQAINRVKSHSALVFTVTELEHLKASGRTEGATQVTDAPIKMKPVVSVEDGVPKVVAQARTQRAALDKVIEIGETRAGGKPIIHLGIVHGNIEAKAQELAAEAASAFEFSGPVPIVDFGPALAVHFGPGLLGIAVHWDVDRSLA